MEGSERLVRAFGVREILAGVITLSVEKNAGRGRPASAATALMPPRCSRA